LFHKEGAHCSTVFILQSESDTSSETSYWTSWMDLLWKYLTLIPACCARYYPEAPTKENQVNRIVLISCYIVVYVHHPVVRLT
jgi:hypothetical protein